MDGNGNGQPLTRQDLLDLMTQIREYVDGSEQRVKAYVDERFAGLDERFAGLDERFQTLKEYVDERTHDAETRLLRGFANFAETFEVRMRKLSADVGNLNTATDMRLTAVEERLLADRKSVV